MRPDIRKTYKQIISMLLSFAMVIGSIYISGKNRADAAEDGGSYTLTVTEVLELSASDEFQDDNGNTITLADLNQLIVSTGAKLTISGTGLTAGNEGLVVSVGDNAGLSRGAVTLTCSSLLCSGEVVTMNGGSFQCGSVEL